ncbi:tyrosine kinase family protein [Medicago truncatula]|uniref:Tyrosine kinase family protein n=1 Tax=Medicago truncatula TaxID=3880 RepID=G8A0C7_MEDTR|nr:tyrosine kinase family protein [Medicago truncatula]
MITSAKYRLLVVDFIRICLTLQTAKAIDVLHSSNPLVIHRDIKSANVLIDQDAGIS